MKLQVDTVNKTITIEEPVNLSELYRLLQAMLPQFAWENYTLVPSAGAPVTIIREVEKPIPSAPYTPTPWIIPTWQEPFKFPGTTQNPYTITCKAIGAADTCNASFVITTNLT